MIDDDLRDLMPPERRTPPHRKRHLKARLMYDIETDNAPTRRRASRRRLAGGLIAATVLATGAAAAAIGFGGPDPEQASRVVESVADPVAEIYLGDWRPVLRAEFVACIGPNSNRLTDPRETGNTLASEFPLADLLTAELLIEECTSANDWARSQGRFDENRATVCVRDGDFLLAVVALDGLSCGETGDRVRPITDGDLARLNEMRALEVAVLADPEECPSLSEAVDWARTQVETHGETLEIRGISGNNTGCYGATTMWDWGEVVVEQMSGLATPDETQSGLTATTVEPDATGS